MLIDPKSLAGQVNYHVALHCTPKGLRDSCWWRIYKHATPSEVVRFCHVLILLANRENAGSEER